MKASTVKTIQIYLIGLAIGGLITLMVGDNTNQQWLSDTGLYTALTCITGVYGVSFLHKPYKK